MNGVRAGRNRVKALVLDFDGLILDTESTHFTATTEALATVGLVYPLEECLRQVGTVPTVDWMGWAEATLGRELTERERIDLRHGHRARHLELVSAQEVRPGVVALLEAAMQRGVPCAVASSSSSTWVEGHLAVLGLRSLFVAIRCRDHVERVKPAPDLYVAALAALGVETAREAVAFEDSQHGTTAAKAAAMTCVACPGPITAAQDFAHADLRVDSLAHVGWDTIEELLMR